MAWNLVKMGKSIHHLMTTYGEGNDLEPMEKDLTGESRVDHVVSLYREMNVPFGIMMMLKNRVSENGRHIIWGRKWNDRKYVEETVIPKLMDYDYLSSLPPNTVAVHDVFEVHSNFEIFREITAPLKYNTSTSVLETSKEETPPGKPVSVLQSFT